MKKAVVLLLIFVYTFAMAGTTIAMHFCMGERIGTSLGYEEQNECELCHMEKHTTNDLDHCCKDTHQFVKVNLDQDIAPVISSPSIPLFFISHLVSGRQYVIFTAWDEMATAEAAVPPDTPVYQRNCNFRI